MQKDAQPPDKSSLMLALGILGILSGLLSTWLLLRLKAPTGTQLILCGLALFGQGMTSGWCLARSGAHSPTGHTSNLPDDSPQPPTTKYEPCSHLKVYPVSGEPPSR